jgi:hypothetical protein
MGAEDAILSQQVFIAQQQFLIDQSRDEGEQARPMQWITHENVHHTPMPQEGRSRSDEYFDDEWRGLNFHRDLEGQWVDRDGGVHTEDQLREMHIRLVPITRYPFVRLVEASGLVAREGESVVAMAKARLERERMERVRLQAESQMRIQRPRATSIKGIEEFREDAKYGGDGTRVDLAYAIYALAHGVDLATVEGILRSRDLSHKGNEKRQRDYIERTVQKAMVFLERGRER